MTQHADLHVPPPTPIPHYSVDPRLDKYRERVAQVPYDMTDKEKVEMWVRIQNYVVHYAPGKLSLNAFETDILPVIAECCKATPGERKERRKRVLNTILRAFRYTTPVVQEDVEKAANNFRTLYCHWKKKKTMPHDPRWAWAFRNILLDMDENLNLVQRDVMQESLVAATPLLAAMYLIGPVSARKQNTSGVMREVTNAHLGIAAHLKSMARMSGISFVEGCSRLHGAILNAYSNRPVPPEQTSVRSVEDFRKDLGEVFSIYKHRLIHPGKDKGQIAMSEERLSLIDEVHNMWIITPALVTTVFCNKPAVLQHALHTVNVEEALYKYTYGADCTKQIEMQCVEKALGIIRRKMAE